MNDEKRIVLNFQRERKVWWIVGKNNSPCLYVICYQEHVKLMLIRYVVSFTMPLQLYIQAGNNKHNSNVNRLADKVRSRFQLRYVGNSHLQLSFLLTLTNCKFIVSILIIFKFAIKDCAETIRLERIEKCSSWTRIHLGFTADVIFQMLLSLMSRLKYLKHVEKVQVSSSFSLYHA